MIYFYLFINWNVCVSVCECMHGEKGSLGIAQTIFIYLASETFKWV